MSGNDERRGETGRAGDERTVVAPLPADDRTLVVPRAADDDRTLVATPPAADDRTLVAPPPAADDRTLVMPHAASTTATAGATTTGAARREPDAVARAATGSERFELGKVLGEGGLSTVFLARDAALRRSVALKFLKRGEAQAAERFLEEAQITAQLQHPNIVPIYDIGANPAGERFLAMKPVAGHEFATVIAEAHQASGRRGAGERLRELLEIFGKICDAVAYAHSCGVIHRDLKPANVMVGAFGEVLVMDWGLAKPIGFTPGSVTEADRKALGRTDAVTSDRRLDGTHTVVGTIQGTPAYMAPEQALGGARLDEGCDIYALGGILYTLLTGMRPVEGDSLEDQLTSVRQSQLQPPTRRAPMARIPPELEAIVLKAMAHARGDRYASVQELKAEIEAFLDNGFVKAARYSPLQRLRKWVLRHPTAGVAVAMSVLLVAIASSGLSLYLDSERRAQQEAVARAEAERQAIAEREQAAGAREQAAAAREQAASAREQAAADRELATTREGERIAAEQREREERLRRLVQEKKYAELQRDLGSLKRDVGLQTEAQRDAAITEFTAGWKQAQARNASPEDFVAGLGRNEFDRYLGAFERRFQAARHGAATLGVDDYFYYGVLLQLGANRLADAVAQYDSVLKLDPQHKAALVNRGMALSRLGRHEDALRDQDAALERWPEQASNRLNRGATYYAMGRYDDAIADYRQVLATDERDARAWMNLGSALAAKGDQAAALEAAGRATSVDPQLAEAQATLGTLLADAKQLQPALAAWERAVRLKPAEARYLAGRGRVQAQLGDHAKSLADLDRAVALGARDAATLTDRAAQRSRLGKNAEALADLDAVLRADKGNDRALMTRATVRGRLGDLAGALADLNAYLARHPDDALALSNRCATHHRLGNLDQAFADADRAANLRPDDARMLSNRGDMHRVLGRYEAARTDLERAVELDPAYHRAYVYLGQTQLALKNTAAAMTAFDNAVRVAGDRDGSALAARAMAKEDQGDFAGAATDYLAAIRIDGSLCEAWQRLGLMRLAHGSKDGARETLKQAATVCTDPALRAPVVKALGELGVSVP